MLRRIKFLFFLSLVLLIGPRTVLIAQSDSLSRGHSIVLEAGGPAGYWAVGYERSNLVGSSPKSYLRLDLSVFHLNNYEGEFDPSVSLAFAYGFLLGSGRHKLELGLLDALFTDVVADERLESKRILIVNLAGIIGYRYLPKNDKLSLRIYYTPTLFNLADATNTGTGMTFVHWGGMGIGYRIK